MMSNLKDKRNGIALIEELIENECFGIVEEAKKIKFIMPEMFRIKKLLALKSKQAKGYEKELFYKVSVKLTLNNYMEFFKILDTHFKNKKKDDNEDRNNNIDKKQLSPRKSSEITIGTNTIPDYLKERLQKYVYFFDKDDKYIHVYLRNKDEYKRNLAELKFINNAVNKNMIKIKIHLISESQIIINMNKLEKKEFVEFLNSY